MTQIKHPFTPDRFTEVLKECTGTMPEGARKQAADVSRRLLRDWLAWLPQDWTIGRLRSELVLSEENPPYDY